MSLVGRLEDLALPDIFQIISLSKKTGTLVVRSRKGTGMVVFKNGQVVQAGSDVIRDSLGNILVSQGMIAQADLAAALARNRPSANIWWKRRAMRSCSQARSRGSSANAPRGLRISLAAGSRSCSTSEA